MSINQHLDEHLTWLNLPTSQQRSYNVFSEDMSSSFSSSTADTSPSHSAGFSQPWSIPELYDMRILPRDTGTFRTLKGSVSPSTLYSPFDNHDISEWLDRNATDATHLLECGAIYGNPTTFNIPVTDFSPVQLLEASSSTNDDQNNKGLYRDYAPYSYIDSASHIDQLLEENGVLGPIIDRSVDCFNSGVPRTKAEEAPRAIQNPDDDPIKAESDDNEQLKQNDYDDRGDRLSILAPISPSISPQSRERPSFEYISTLQEEHNNMRSQRRSRRSKPEWRVRELDGSNVLFKLDGIEFDSNSESYHSVSKQKFPNTCQEVCNGVVCGKRYQRREHLARHALSHSRVRQFRCKICRRAFSRNDNRNDHYWTHVFRPGTRSRNRRLSLQQVLQAVSDENPNVTARLIERWESEVLNVQ